MQRSANNWENFSGLDFFQPSNWPGDVHSVTQSPRGEFSLPEKQSNNLEDILISQVVCVSIFMKL